VLLTAIREVQIPLLAALMLGGCSAKLLRALRTWNVDEALGPTALFPMRLRKPLSIAFCVIECGLGVGLILTAGGVGKGAPATYIRLGVWLMFLVATSALLEMRATRPDVGCGCFGDFSTAPVSNRTMARSALLSFAALSTIRLPAITQPKPGADTVRLLVIMAIELIVLAALSPELGEGLIRLGYSEPCELRTMSAERTLAALRRSKQWRRHCGVITADAPTDVWRELCWRYVVFPAQYGERSTEVVFAVFLQHRRPAVHAALVDAVTGEPLPWPAQPHRTRPVPAPRLRPVEPAIAAALVPAQPVPAQPVAAQPVAAQPVPAQQFPAQPVAASRDMPVSSDV
jgi:hypothetical protein